MEALRLGPDCARVFLAHLTHMTCVPLVVRFRLPCQSELLKILPYDHDSQCVV